VAMPSQRRIRLSKSSWHAMDQKPLIAEAVPMAAGWSRQRRQRGQVGAERLIPTDMFSPLKREVSVGRSMSVDITHSLRSKQNSKDTAAHAPPTKLRTSALPFS
jgi:hypothetical protein